jgi:transposase
LVFRRQVAGANASANLYSLLQICKVNGIDGYDDLRKLLMASTADYYEALLPWSVGASGA